MNLFNLIRTHIGNVLRVGRNHAVQHIDNSVALVKGAVFTTILLILAALIGNHGLESGNLDLERWAIKAKNAIAFIGTVFLGFIAIRIRVMAMAARAANSARSSGALGGSVTIERYRRWMSGIGVYWMGVLFYAVIMPIHENLGWSGLALMSIMILAAIANACWFETTWPRKAFAIVVLTVFVLVSIAIGIGDYTKAARLSAKAFASKRLGWDSDMVVAGEARERFRKQLTFKKKARFDELYSELLELRSKLLKCQPPACDRSNLERQIKEIETEICLLEKGEKDCTEQKLAAEEKKEPEKVPTPAAVDSTPPAPVAQPDPVQPPTEATPAAPVVRQEPKPPTGDTVIAQLRKPRAGCPMGPNTGRIANTSPYFTHSIKINDRTVVDETGKELKIPPRTSAWICILPHSLGRYYQVAISRYGTDLANPAPVKKVGSKLWFFHSKLPTGHRPYQLAVIGQDQS